MFVVFKPKCSKMQKNTLKIKLSSIPEILVMSNVGINANYLQQKFFINIPSGDVCLFQTQMQKNVNKKFGKSKEALYLKF